MSILKKIIFLCLISFIPLTTCHAVRIICEPHTEDSVVYCIMSHDYTFQVQFINLVNKNNESKAWLRVRENRDDRFLWYADIVVDGEKFRINRMIPTYEEEEAGRSQRDMLYENQPRELYLIPKEIVDKLITAKNVHVIFNKASKLNIDFEVGTRSLKNINAMMDLKYDDMNEWWHPIIKD